MLLKSEDQEGTQAIIILLKITAHGSVENAVAASKFGANDYLIKPFGKEAMQFVIEKALGFR